MPGDHGYDNEEKERKQRIKKLKTKTSKMRLAAVNKMRLAVEDAANPNLDKSDPNTTSTENARIDRKRKRSRGYGGMGNNNIPKFT